MFRHEDFGGQLVWALQHYVQVHIQGPEQSFFEEETLGAAYCSWGEHQSMRRALTSN